MLANLLKNPLIRNGITIITIGIALYFAYREYNKMMDRIEIIANEMYKAKQEIAMLKRQSQTFSKNKNVIHNLVKEKTKTPNTTMLKEIETEIETDIIPTIINPIQINKLSNSMNRISKHLPTKTSFEIVVEDAKIINDSDIISELESDSDIISESDNILNSDDEINTSENSEIDLDENSEIDLDENTEIDLDENSEIDLDENSDEELENNLENTELEEQLEKEVSSVDINEELNTNNQILKNEIQKLSSEIEKDESNDNGQKIFGINTTIIKPSPIKPTKRKSRQGVVTSWSVFLKDKAIEKQLLENSPKADFGTLSALKSQIWKSYTNEQKNIYKQKASELTKLNKKNKKKS